MPARPGHPVSTTMRCVRQRSRFTRVLYWWPSSLLCGAGTWRRRSSYSAPSRLRRPNVIVFVLARRAGRQIPIGGKEGWYWFVLMPVLIPALLAPALSRWRAVAWWLVMWDLVITEVALFHDFAGMSSSVHGSMLFRWGPCSCRSPRISQESPPVLSQVERR